MPLVAASELQKAEAQRKQIKKETYKKILDQISKKIQTISESKGTNTFVTVPPLVVGFPIYNRSTAAVYIERQLKNAGYYVRRVSEYDIYVDWKVRKKDGCDAENRTAEDDMGLPSFLNLKKYAAKYK
jgi:hypothetical protein